MGTSSVNITRKFHFPPQLFCGGITHSIRAVLSRNLRKQQGKTVECIKDGNTRCYRIAA